MKITPGLLKFGLNIYGHYLGAGVRIRHISKDFRQIRVTMKLKELKAGFFNSGPGENFKI